jgi:hypothetical protein
MFLDFACNKKTEVYVPGLLRRNDKTDEMVMNKGIQEY